MSEVAFEHTQFDRFFYLPFKAAEIRAKPIAYDIRHGVITAELLGGHRDGEIIRAEKQDFRIHWDVPKDHPDW